MSEKNEFKAYKEWREIMHRDYSQRDEIIFLAGYTFANIDNNCEEE